jgi:hypothetical protein
VRELIRRERPDVAHVYNALALVSPSIYNGCRDEGVPVVQTLYNYRLLCPAATFLRDGRICEECASPVRAAANPDASRRLLDRTFHFAGD